jgi:hypothetical protein
MQWISIIAFVLLLELLTWFLYHYSIQHVPYCCNLYRISIGLPKCILVRAVDALDAVPYTEASNLNICELGKHKCTATNLRGTHFEMRIFASNRSFQSFFLLSFSFELYKTCGFGK